MGLIGMENSLEEVAFELLEDSATGADHGFARGAKFPMVIELKKPPKPRFCCALQGSENNKCATDALVGTTK
jgi:hypothetical protein